MEAEARVIQRLDEVERCLTQMGKSRAIQFNLERKIRDQLAQVRRELQGEGEPPPGPQAPARP